MATVNSDVLRFLQAGLKTRFVDAYRRRLKNAAYPKIATVIETTLPTQDYAQLSSNPTMRQWTDERVKKALKQLNPTYQITDKTWEASLSISRRSIEDDQYGRIMLQAKQLGTAPIQHKEQYVTQTLALGFSASGMDTGATFFSTTHMESGSAQSNRTTNPLTATNLAAAISAMMVFTDDQGVQLGIQPDTLVCGPSNMFNARQILNSSQVVGYGGGTNTTTPSDNPLKGVADLVVASYLTGTYANYWFVLDTSRELGAVILQERTDVPLEFTANFDPDVPAVFNRDEYEFGARARYEVGYGLWQTAYGAIL